MTDPYQPYSGQVPPPGQPPVPYGAPMYGYVPYPVAPPLRTSGMAIAGMVVGIVALVFFWVPFFDVVAAIAAIGLSWAGMVQAGKPGWTGQGMGIAGLVCGILAAIPAILFLVFFIISLSAVGAATCAFYC
ncbi:DUF4190 domain-containing protein [Amycolatopsis benzoatilytica]|uniref:DUF4190 domain-containing protein n=1 Tax=Amycolatopsis benzoatilytica TaxID=346045 RepID=UPI000373CD83|nr:DUF4190 domain-containing protein [Amycolatopsis benzoatilytica]